MKRVQSWMMWVAGMLAVLGSVGIVRLPLHVVFIQIDVLMPIVALLCFAVAYVNYENTSKNSVLNWALWIAGAVALLTLLPVISLPIILPLVQVNGLMLIVGFVCLLIAYLKTWGR